MSLYSGVVRRRPSEPTPAPRPEPPEFSSFKARRAWRDAHGIITQGPSGPPERHAPQKSHFADTPELVAHHEDVCREIAEIDKFSVQVDERIAALGVSPDREGLRDLRIKLQLLRREIEADLPRWPEGTPEQRRYVRARARELRESCWHNADRLRRAGEYRQADIMLMDSFSGRARMIAEHEIGLRPHLSGY